ncbi:MAG TPA: hypothetical protein EYO33_15320, partial [Phycisphaerales bacterium]|nr:hypothetical protein [Phycisphaerales bacterium]
MRDDAGSSMDAGVTRRDLLRWVWPHCDKACVALHTPVGDGESRIGWINDEADAKRAISAFVAGKLVNERFESKNKAGKPYTIEGATRLGLVLHHDGVVSMCCMDLDDHADDGGNLHQLEPLCRFLGARPVVYTSKGGKGLHAFFVLRNPMPTDEFVQWSKRWGFNRDG